MGTTEGEGEVLGRGVSSSSLASSRTFGVKFCGFGEEVGVGLAWCDLLGVGYRGRLVALGREGLHDILDSLSSFRTFDEEGGKRADSGGVVV
jgi:hypothetical protein